MKNHPTLEIILWRLPPKCVAVSFEECWVIKTETRHQWNFDLRPNDTNIWEFLAEDIDTHNKSLEISRSFYFCMSLCFSHELCSFVIIFLVYISTRASTKHMKIPFHHTAVFMMLS